MLQVQQQMQQQSTLIKTGLHSAASGGKLRNRSFTLSGGAAAKLAAVASNGGAGATSAFSNLSRHLSSSCLAAGGRLHLMSQSTSSLRKAISSSTLNKSRSMNLINRRHHQEHHHQHSHQNGRSAADLQTPWSNESAGNSDDCSSSADGEERPEEEEDVDDELEEEEEEDDVRRSQQQQSQNAQGGSTEKSEERPKC